MPGAYERKPEPGEAEFNEALSNFLTENGLLKP